MLLRLFVSVFICVIGLDQILFSMDNQLIFSMDGDSENISERLDQLDFESSSESCDCDKNEKMMDDFTYFLHDRHKQLASRKFDENHDLIIIQEKPFVLQFILSNNKTKLSCLLGKYRVPEVNAGFFCRFINDSNKIEVCYKNEHKNILIDLEDNYHFAEKHNEEDLVLYSIKMISFKLNDGKVFRAMITTDATGYVGIYKGDFCSDGYVIDESLKKRFVTYIDALKINDEDFIFAFVVNFQCVYLYRWNIESDPKCLDKINLSSQGAVEKITLDEKTQKIVIELKEEEEPLYKNFPHELQKALLETKK